MAFAPADIVIYNGNSQTLTVAVATVGSAIPVNDATVTARLMDRDEMEIFNSNCPYLAASDGLYTLDIVSAFNQSPRSGYFLHLNVVSPTALTSNIRKRVSVRNRY